MVEINQNNQLTYREQKPPPVWCDFCWRWPNWPGDKIRLCQRCWIIRENLFRGDNNRLAEYLERRRPRTHTDITAIGGTAV